MAIGDRVYHPALERLRSGQALRREGDSRMEVESKVNIRPQKERRGLDWGVRLCLDCVFAGRCGILDSTPSSAPHVSSIVQ